MVKFDKSLLRGKDLGLFNIVTDFLDTLSLDYKVVGSVVDETYKYNPRSYRDIDILVNYVGGGRKADITRGEAILTLTDYTEMSKCTRNNGIFDNGISNYMDSMEDYDNYYDLTEIAQRFKVYDPKTKTKIDLCFEAKDPEYVNMTKSQKFYARFG